MKWILQEKILVTLFPVHWCICIFMVISLALRYVYDGRIDDMCYKSMGKCKKDVTPVR